MNSDKVIYQEVLYAYQVMCRMIYFCQRYMNSDGKMTAHITVLYLEINTDLNFTSSRLKFSKSQGLCFRYTFLKIYFYIQYLV